MAPGPPARSARTPRLPRGPSSGSRPLPPAARGGSDPVPLYTVEGDNLVGADERLRGLVPLELLVQGRPCAGVIVSCEEAGEVKQVDRVPVGLLRPQQPTHDPVGETFGRV